MHEDANVLPPPEGLDKEEIATEAGLRAAIERESKKLHDTREHDQAVTPDSIRLISFLVSEIRRRIDILSAEEKQELDNINEKARMLDATRRVHEITASIQAYFDVVNTPRKAVRFSAMNELEDSVSSMMHTLDQNPEHFKELLNEMQISLDNLEELKSKNPMLQGFQQF